VAPPYAPKPRTPDSKGKDLGFTLNCLQMSLNQGQQSAKRRSRRYHACSSTKNPFATLILAIIKYTKLLQHRCEATQSPSPSRAASRFCHQIPKTKGGVA